MYMSFLYQTHNAFSPPGTIAQYIGTMDPDGWLICNGLLRTELDGRFESLSNLLNSITPGSSHTNTKCTPPNLSGRVLYGKAGSDLIGSTGGNLTHTLLENHLPAHTHTISNDKHNHGGFTGDHTHVFKGSTHNHGVDDPGHSHGHKSYNIEHGMIPGGTDSWTQKENHNTYGNALTNITINNETATGKVELNHAVINNGKTNITVNNTATATAFDITPPYFVIHYIIKY